MPEKPKNGVKKASGLGKKKEGETRMGSFSIRPCAQSFMDPFFKKKNCWRNSHFIFHLID